MDKTPVSKLKSLSRLRAQCPTDILRRKEDPDSTQLICSSPTVDNPDSENDESFTQIASTQEGCENIDVVWDWNSPQAKQRPKRSHKRLQLAHSPKIPIKRHPSNHSIQDFEKLREELKMLRDEIANPEHEDLLQLSPIEEAAYKSINIADGDAYLNMIDHDNFCQPQPSTQELIPDDFFNDSLDEQLIHCSQLVEPNSVSNKLHILNEEKRNNIAQKTKIEDLPAKPLSFKKANTDIQRMAHDSFDEVLGQTRVENLISRVTSSCTADSKPSKVEFHRTRSFEMSSMNTLSGTTLDKSKLDEIERKRKEALAKLELKKKQGFFTNSPIQCTMEEIEQKRLQALAKKEAKMLQDIEQKRQEAVKRLEMRRKKNAAAIKSSLSTRLN